MTERARLIVVDRDQEFRRSLVDELRRHGYDCDAIGDAKAGLAALHGDSYDGVIVNLDMAEFERLEPRQENEAFQGFQAPLIAVADEPSISTAVKALRLGAVEYLAKPIKSADLKRAVGLALEKSRAMWGVRRAQDAIETWTRWFRYLEEILVGSGSVRLPSSLRDAISQQRPSPHGLTGAARTTTSPVHRRAAISAMHTRPATTVRRRRRRAIPSVACPSRSR